MTIDDDDDSFDDEVALEHELDQRRNLAAYKIYQAKMDVGYPEQYDPAQDYQSCVDLFDFLFGARVK